MQLRKFLFSVGFSAATVIGFSPIAIALNYNTLSVFLTAQQPNCSKPITDRELRICSQLHYDRENSKLDRVYNQLQKQLPSNRQQQLIQSQKLWMAFRDAYCDLRKSPVAGGTAAPIIHYGCLSHLTQLRASELTIYTQNQIPVPISPNLQVPDRKLDLIYQKMMGKIEPKYQNQLKLVQGAWMVFRDANCQFESSQAGTNREFCRVRMTEQQADRLTELGEMFF
ncbi:MAG: lysozyme inhibitor LprI family protein [Microcoleus sp.]